MIAITTAQKPFIHTIARLIQYAKHKKRAEILSEEIAFAGPSVTAGYSLTPGSGGVSDSTGRLASSLSDKLSELRIIEHEIKIIDMALGMLSDPKRLIVETRFMTACTQDKESFTTLRNNSRKHKWKVMHYQKYEQLRDEAIREISYLLEGNRSELEISE